MCSAVPADSDAQFARDCRRSVVGSSSAPTGCESASDFRNCVASVRYWRRECVSCLRFDYEHFCFARFRFARFGFSPGSHSGRTASTHRCIFVLYFGNLKFTSVFLFKSPIKNWK